MKLNWAERWVVNNYSRVIQQRIEMNMLRYMASLDTDARVLEIGCGRGAGAGLILEKFKAATVHAMDLDEHMIQKALGYLSPQQLQKIVFNVADVVNLPYRSGIFDAVFCFGVLHHVLDWRGGIAEIVRVLKIGGHFFFEELYPSLYQNSLTRHILLHPTEDRFKSEDLKAALHSTKLLIKDVKEIKKLGILGVAVKQI